MIEEIPKIAQTRINIRNAGFCHVMTEHMNISKNKSQFTIGKIEIQKLLTMPQIIQEHIQKDPISGNYYRIIELDHFIGTDKFDNFNKTKHITIITDRFGSLKTVFPGQKI